MDIPPGVNVLSLVFGPAARRRHCEPVGERRPDLGGDHRPGDLGGGSLPGRVGSGSPEGLHRQVPDPSNSHKKAPMGASRSHTQFLTPPPSSCPQDGPGAGQRHGADRHRNLSLLRPEQICLQRLPPQGPAEAEGQHPAERADRADASHDRRAGDGLGDSDRGTAPTDRG